MKKLHIINLGKMGGVERLFLQYINDTTDGSNQVRRHTLRKNSTAQITAMPIRMFLAGSTAWSSV